MVSKIILRQVAQEDVKKMCDGGKLAVDESMDTFEDKKVKQTCSTYCTRGGVIFTMLDV